MGALQMKILQINNQHYLKGGAHRVYLDSATLLKENGHEVYFFSLNKAFLMLSIILTSF